MLHWGVRCVLPYVPQGGMRACESSEVVLVLRYGLWVCVAMLWLDACICDGWCATWEFRLVNGACC